MKSVITALTLSLIATSAIAQEPAGFERLSLTLPHHEGAIAAAIWYPATGGGTPLRDGNAVFKGVPVLEKAPLAKGKFPLVIARHPFYGAFGMYA